MDSEIEIEIGILESVAKKLLEEAEIKTSYPQEYQRGWSKEILFSCEAFRAILKGRVD